MTRTFRKRSLVRGLGIVLIGASLGGAAQAANCASSTERDSFTVRTLQTQLMVAALSCGAREQYNAFVLRYRPHLADHGHTLKRYFKRAFGRSSQRQLDHYVTELANVSSQVSNGDRAAFCARSAQYLDALLAAAKSERGRTLTELAGLHVAAARDPAPACDALTRR